MVRALSKAAGHGLRLTLPLVVLAVFCSVAAAASSPDPQKLVVTTGLPQGVKVSDSGPVSDSDVEANGGSVSNRVGGYHVVYTTPTGGQITMVASVYKSPEDAAASLPAESAAASKGLTEGTPPDTLGDESHFYATPPGTAPSEAQYALAWQEGSVVGVVYGKGVTEDDVLNLAEAQEYLIGAADTTPTLTSTTSTTGSTDAGGGSSSGSSSSSFPWWIVAVIVVVAGIVGGVLFFRRRNAAAGSPGSAAASPDGTGETAEAVEPTPEPPAPPVEKPFGSERRYSAPPAAESQDPPSASSEPPAESTEEPAT